MGYSWATDTARLLQRLEVPAETPDMQHCHVINWVECGTRLCFLGLQVELKPRQSTTRDLKQVAAGAHSLITGKTSARTKWVTHPMIKVARMHPKVD